MHRLHTAWLHQTELRKLDALQASCLRQILHVPHFFISHITNTEVWRRACCAKLSAILQYRQLLLLGNIACLPHDDVQRRCVFQSASFELKLPALPRRRGHSRHTWNNEVYRLATQVCGNKENLFQVWRKPSEVWR